MGSTERERGCLSRPESSGCFPSALFWVEEVSGGQTHISA